MLKLKEFQEWLEKGGAELLPIKNPWETVRFKTARGTHVIYRNKSGASSYSDPHAEEAFKAFTGKKPWMSPDKVKRRSRKYLETAIMKRDGDKCFFCCKGFTEEKPATIEHLLALGSGGNNTIANLALAHEDCNKLAACMSIAEKVKLREKLSGENNNV